MASQITEFDLKEIFRIVWGYNAPPFMFDLQNKVQKKLGFNTPSESNEAYDFGSTTERRETNIKGSPFYARNANGNEVFLPIWLIKPDDSRYLLQNTVSSMTCKKTIVETALVARQGTVKEMISVDDWDINVKGIIVSPDDDYPDQQVYDLNQLFLMNVPLGVDNARISLIIDLSEEERKHYIDGAEMMVIKSLSFPELKGMKNCQPFEMNLVSDFGFELYEK